MRRTVTNQREPDERPITCLAKAPPEMETLHEQLGTPSGTIAGNAYAAMPPRSQDSREIEEFGKLTPRLREMLQLIANGYSTKQIASHLKISTKTVEFHRSRLAKQLGIYPIALLTRYAVRVGAIPP